VKREAFSLVRESVKSAGGRRRVYRSPARAERSEWPSRLAVKANPDSPNHRHVRETDFYLEVGAFLCSAHPFEQEAYFASV